ncbi:MAG: carboxypeptidase-like regulatory domain-containing protein, partial [Bacteroidales bacterium]|nr:carboxypeptidase-like regulatory domain-containing protein [Bacteroidales bacterium]
MKNVIVLLFIVNFQLSASISGVSQNKVDLNLENTSLLECLREIEKQTDFGTLYNHKEMKEVKGLDVNLNDETIENALDHIFEKTDYTYIIKNRVILVKTKPQKNQLRTNTLQKEKPEIIKITGKVISDDGLPLPGVNVVVKDFPTIGSATNMDGNYSITVPSKAEVLIFSSVGMIAQEIKIEGKTVIDVELKTDMLGLKEVVVTGYSSISKERATGSFIKMKSKDLEEVHHLDVSKKIKYSAPGVLLSTKASDGGEETIIEMRGKATLKGSSSPLLVIDGFAVEAKLSQINPNDIETINILQDAAAASIWGARAANGVIVINTKKGSKADAPAIEFFYNTKVYQQPKVSDLQLASSRDVIDAHVEAMDKNIDYVVAGLIHPHNGTYERDVYLNPVQAIWCKHKANPQTYTLSMRNADLDKLAKNNVSDQYEDLLLQTGIAHDANLSIRGGNKRANYFLSYNYRNTKSVYVGDNTERNTITLNNGFKLNERIRLNTGVNLFFDNQEYNGVGLSYLIGYNNIPVYMPLQDASGNNTRYYYEGSKSVNTMKDYESRGYLPFGYNPYQIVLDNDNNRTSRNMRVNASLKYKIIDGLDWIVSGMYNTSSRKHENYSDYGAAKVNRLINKFSYFK